MSWCFSILLKPVSQAFNVSLLCWNGALEDVFPSPGCRIHLKQETCLKYSKFLKVPTFISLPCLLRWLHFLKFGRSTCQCSDMQNIFKCIIPTNEFLFKHTFNGEKIHPEITKNLSYEFFIFCFHLICLVYNTVDHRLFNVECDHKLSANIISLKQS